VHTIVQFDVYLQYSWFTDSSAWLKPSRFCELQILARLILARVSEVGNLNIIRPCLGQKQPVAHRVDRENSSHQKFTDKQSHLFGWIQKLDSQLRNMATRRELMNAEGLELPNNKFFMFAEGTMLDSRPESNAHVWVHQVAGIINGQSSDFHTTCLVRAFADAKEAVMGQGIIKTNLVVLHPWSVMRWKSILEEHSLTHLFIENRDVYNRVSVQEYENYDFLLVSASFLKSSYYKTHANKTFQKRLFDRYLQEIPNSDGLQHSEEDLRRLCGWLLLTMPPNLIGILKQVPLHLLKWQRCVLDDLISMPTQHRFMSLSTWAVLARDSVIHSAVINPVNLAHTLQFCYSHTKKSAITPVLSVHDPSVQGLLSCCLFDYQESLFTHSSEILRLNREEITDSTLNPLVSEIRVFNSLKKKLSAQDELLFWVHPSCLGITTDDLLSCYTPAEYKCYVQSRVTGFKQIPKALAMLQEDLQNLKDIEGALLVEDEQTRAVPQLVSSFGQLARGCGYPEMATIRTKVSPNVSEDHFQSLFWVQFRRLFSKSKDSVDALRKLLALCSTRQQKAKYLTKVMELLERGPVESCPICFDAETDTITDCGHLFCRLHSDQF